MFEAERVARHASSRMLMACSVKYVSKLLAGFSWTESWMRLRSRDVLTWDGEAGRLHGLARAV